MKKKLISYEVLASEYKRLEPLRLQYAPGLQLDQFLSVLFSGSIAHLEGAGGAWPHVADIQDALKLHGLRCWDGKTYEPAKP